MGTRMWQLFIANMDVYVTVFIVAGIVAYAIAVTSLFMRFREYRVKKKRRFFRALLEGFRNGSVCTVEDVIDIYRGIYPTSSGVDHHRYGLSRQLREFLVELISKRLEHANDDALVLEWKEKLSEFIRVSDAKAPFIDLPPHERNVLEDLSNYIENSDRDGMRRKMLELGGLLRSRLDVLERLQGINRWSIPISIVGLLLTVVFGVFAIIK